MKGKILEPDAPTTVYAVKVLVYITFLSIFFLLFLDDYSVQYNITPNNIIGFILMSAAFMIYIETLFEKNVLNFKSRLDTLPVGIGAFSGTVSLIVGLGLFLDIKTLVELFEPFMTYVYLKVILVLLYAWTRGSSK